MFFVYILRSLRDQGFYFGSCEHIEKRLTDHNKEKVRSTKGRLPFVIHYSESYATRSEAFRREHFFKSIDEYNWLKKQQII